MKKILISLIKDEDGAVAVIVAVTMTVLMTFCAFAVDFGSAYLRTSEIQNAADASVLAAGRYLPIDVADNDKISQAKGTAILYAQKNNADTLTYDDIVLGDIVNNRYTSIYVNIPTTVELFFAKTIGINNLSVSRHAKSQIAPASHAGGVAPLGVEYVLLEQAIANNATKHINLKYAGGDGTQGSYNAIDLDGVQGGGANEYNYWLEFGYDGQIEIGNDLLPVEKGNMAGPTDSAINEKYNACTHYLDDGGCNSEHYEISCPRIIKILVIEKVGKSYVRVLGFAAFVIESPTNANGEVLGSYIKYLEPGELGNSDWGTTDFGVYNLGLSQ